MIYSRPGPALELTVDPALESWDKAGTPSQVRLTGFLNSLEELFGDHLLMPPPLALDLVVGLSRSVSLTSGGHDLDNYLYPIVRRFGHHRFFAVFAQKVHGTSSVAFGQTTRLDEVTWAPQMRCRTTSSGQSLRWKSEVAEACRACAPSEAIQGPIALDVHFRLSGKRNWAQQWKPTIDALGAVLGNQDPSKPYNTMDDRIVRLGLFRTVDDGMGWDIDVEVAWQAT